MTFYTFSILLNIERRRNGWCTLNVNIIVLTSAQFYENFTIIVESLQDTRITTRSFGIKTIRFHEVCDSNIKLYGNFTRATQSRLNEDGMCFMNRPMQLEEKVHIYGLTSSCVKPTFRETCTKLKIGLTNTDPEEVRDLVQQKQYYVRGLKEVNCTSEKDRKVGFFHICIFLSPNATLSLCVNGTQNYSYKNQEISAFCPVWLVIQPYGIRSIGISNK